MAAAAVRAGAPDGGISCLEHASIAATGGLMSHPAVALVLATGGASMVRAAYRSGKPTLAVGAGNVPVYVHRSVPDLDEAAEMITTSKAFDNGTACVAEQSVVLDEAIAGPALAGLAGRGTVMLTPGEQQRLAGLIFDERGGLRPENVGQSAPELARRIAMTVPAGTPGLGARPTGGGA